MKEKIIIALASKMAGGKSSATDYLVEKYGALSIKYSSVLTEILQKLNLENNRRNLQDLSQSLRKTFGENILEKAIEEKINQSKNALIVLDGVRRREDIEDFLKKDNFYLIFIEVDEKLRLGRIKKRFEKEDDGKKNLKVFRKEEKHNSETREKELKKIAKYIIGNNGSLKDFEKRVDQVMNQILN